MEVTMLITSKPNDGGRPTHPPFHLDMSSFPPLPAVESPKHISSVSDHSAINGQSSATLQTDKPTQTGGSDISADPYDIALATSCSPSFREFPNPDAQLSQQRKIVFNALATFQRIR